MVEENKVTNTPVVEENKAVDTSDSEGEFVEMTDAVE